MGLFCEVRPTKCDCNGQGCITLTQENDEVQKKKLGSKKKSKRQ